MPERSEYPPGTFSWIDCATTDPEAAKTFYTSIFGWTFMDMPVPEGGVYSMATLKGRSVAGVFSKPPEMQAPPHWSSYVTVVDADATAAKATQLGAQILVEPFDVMEAGRMAVIQDKEGAVVSIWQAKANTGAALVNEHGALCWNELMTSDVESAKSFYTELFSWTPEPMGEAYTIFNVGDRGNGGTMAITPEMGPIPPHWAVYFAVDDVDATVKLVTEGGGGILAPPFDAQGVGRAAVVTDPQGAAFSLITLAMVAD